MNVLPSNVTLFNPLTLSDRRKLDDLLLLATMNSEVRQRLLIYRDESLLVDYDLNETARRWLLGIKANSIDELARVILAS